MAFFHLRSDPTSPSLPLMVRQVWSAYRELDRTQWLSTAAIESLQLEHLRSLLAHCYHQIPYYRRVLSEAGIFDRPIKSLEEFRRLPLLTRELYQAQFADLQAHHLPGGMSASGEGYTSGTNGVPIKVRKTNWTDLWWHALSLRDLEWCHLDPFGRLAGIRLLAKSAKDLPLMMQGVSIPFWSKLLDPLLISGISAGMDVRQDPRVQLAWLRRFDPDFLLSMPSNLDLLASLVLESGQRLPRLQVIQAVGETLSDASRQRIEAAFGAAVRNLYSTTEAGYMATSCPLGHGLHVHSENVLVETLDSAGNPCQPGETGRLVMTTLQNYLTPFLRYDILDDVTLASAPCPCGRGLPLLTRIDGRRHPLMWLPDGRRKAISGLYLEIRRVGGCRQFQIVQRAVDHVILRVVPDRAWTPEHAERMRQTVQQEFAAPIRVDVEEKTRLDLPSGGKLKIAIVEMEEEPAQQAHVSG